MAHAHSRAPPSSWVPSCPFLLSRPSHKGHPLHDWHLNSAPLAQGLAVCRRTPGRLRAHLGAARRSARGAPTPPGREPGHPSSEAGTAAPGPSHRKPPPPGARAAPPPAPRGPRPPQACPAPPLACRAPRAGAHYLPRPQKRRPTPLPLPPSTARTRAGSRGRARSPDPEEAGRTRRCGQPRPGLGSLGSGKAFLPFVCFNSGSVSHCLDGARAIREIEDSLVPGASHTPPINAGGGSITSPSLQVRGSHSIKSSNIELLSRVAR